MGIRDSNKDQYAWTQENGVPEAIIRPSDGAIMTPLMKFDSVLNGKATQNLFKLTNNPEKFYRENMISGSNSGTSSNTYGNVNVEQQFNITVAGVANYEEFVSKMQKDNKFEKLVQSMTLDVLKGKRDVYKRQVIIITSLVLYVSSHLPLVTRGLQYSLSKSYRQIRESLEFGKLFNKISPLK